MGGRGVCVCVCGGGLGGGGGGSQACVLASGLVRKVSPGSPEKSTERFRKELLTR